VFNGVGGKLLDLQKIYTCPYCANTDTLRNFFLLKKDKSYSYKNPKCRICNEGMRLKTLLAEFTPYEWGLWIYLNIIVYNSPERKFYDKIHFKVLSMNLNILGKYIKDEFWRGFFDGQKIYRKDGKDECIEILNGINEQFKIVIPYQKKQTLTNFI